MQCNFQQRYIMHGYIRKLWTKLGNLFNTSAFEAESMHFDIFVNICSIFFIYYSRYKSLISLQLTTKQKLYPMFKDSSNSDQMFQIQQWYRNQLQQVQLRFKQIHTDALEQIKSKVRRKQTLQEKDENIELLERQRGKLIEQMKNHVKQCEHPHCKSVKEIVLYYNLRNVQKLKEDPVHMIVKYNESTLYTKTDCPVGSQINSRMLETHRLLKNHVL